MAANSAGVGWHRPGGCLPRFEHGRRPVGVSFARRRWADPSDGGDESARGSGEMVRSNPGIVLSDSGCVGQQDFFDAGHRKRSRSLPVAPGTGTVGLDAAGCGFFRGGTGDQEWQDQEQEGRESSSLHVLVLVALFDGVCFQKARGRGMAAKAPTDSSKFYYPRVIKMAQKRKQATRDRLRKGIRGEPGGPSPSSGCRFFPPAE